MHVSYYNNLPSDTRVLVLGACRLPSPELHRTTRGYEHFEFEGQNNTTTTMLGTPVLSQDGSRKLNCLIEGESIVFPVTAERDWVVGDLKEKIKEK
jgi:hypothetical protein